MIDYINKGKKEVDEWLALVEKVSHAIPNEKEDFDNRRSKELYETALRNISSLKFSDVLNELNNAIRIDPEYEKIQSTILQVEKLIKNNDSFNKLIAEGKRESSNKNSDIAKEKY